MRRRWIYGWLLAVVAVVLGLLAVQFFGKYHVADTMEIAVEEVRASEYPEDPSHRSVFYDRYSGRALTLAKVDDTHFDFIFTSEDPRIATIAFKNIDVSLFIPWQPEWTRGDSNLEVIALTDREWNRQQVRFTRDMPELSVTGGDGFEEQGLVTAELARNCLNAGLWEVLLFTQEGGKKALYYQGWFTFPLGHYKAMFEMLNGVSYWKHWYRLEHWFNPQGTTMDLDALRSVVDGMEVAALCPKGECLLLDGEQVRKARTVDANNVRCWGDFCESRRSVRYASFVPPGRYSVGHPWGNEYERIETMERAFVRQIENPGSDGIRHEIEVVFRNGGTGEASRFIVSGLDLTALPRLPQDSYSKGFYMPMGIGVPPFYQGYRDLQSNPPHRSDYFCVMVDEKNRWINHHDVAIDGPVLHRDIHDPNRVHLYLLSYERHSLVAHIVLQIDQPASQ